MVNKQEAISLRQQGMNYEEISSLMGCSTAWCKKYLKDVVVAVNEDTGKPKTRKEFKMEAIEILEEALRRVRAIQ